MSARNFVTALVVFFASGSVEASLLDNVSQYFNAPLPYNKEESIKILIAKEEPKILLEARGKYKLYDPYSHKHISTRFIGKKKYIEADRDGLKWGEEFPGLHQLLIAPDDPATAILVGNREYQGPIYIYAVDGKLSAVNEINNDVYLLNALAPLSLHELPEEALAAFVIAARSALAYQIERPKSSFWTIEAPQIGYQGKSPFHPPIKLQKAIEDTKRMVLSANDAVIGQLALLPAEWPSVKTPLTLRDTVSAAISLEEAADMANKGAHAAQILQKAFPQAHVQLLR